MLLVLLACGPDPAVRFPAALAPLAENRAPWPAATADDAHPEALEVVSGGDGALWWAHARGYVHAGSGEVWAAARDPDANVDRREVDEWEVDPGTVPGFDDSYTIHCVVHDVITVDYDLTWVHELQDGSAARPERVVAQWEKTAGTTFIQLLRGSLVLTPVDDEVTALEYVEELQATLRDDETVASYLRDLHASIGAVARGEPLPVW